MFQEKKNLFIPGPTPVAPGLLRVTSRPVINHRGPEFHDLFGRVRASLAEVFQTKGKVFILTGSGTSAMEAAVANTISPGDKVLVLVGGAFGERWAKLAETFGAQVERLSYPWGTAANPEWVREALAKDEGIKAVFATQNESSTGVANDIKAIAEARGDHPALLIVDAVSSFGAMELDMDGWGVDVVATASQKCLMMPPGLAFVAFGERAWEAAAQAKTPRFYLDLRQYDAFAAIGETPFTPNVHLCFALEEAIGMLKREGLQAARERHLLMRDMVRAGLSALGMELLVKDERAASPTVTAVLGGDLDIPRFRRIAEDEFGFVLSGGQGELKATSFRIGHMGYMLPVDMVGLLGVIELALTRAGKKTELGQGVKAAQQVLLERT
ncbi:MAG: pyridoxal-phosphate-dependent aminotransferase family protein [Limnochordia bacterium]|jgi:aspartate aminotransferase-like enzyme|nr:alanine--glyoxylate aminotransferase family protein [Bacillota bacterium]